MDKATRDKFIIELMDETYEKVYIFLSKKQYDKDFVEDVVQETFLEAYRKADLLLEHPNRMGWLYTTAKNKMMKLGIKRKEFYTWSEEGIIYSSDICKEDPEYNEIELALTIKNTVSEEEYDMFCDYYLNGYTSTEIADKYNVSEGSIRMRMGRLKKRLKENIFVGLLILAVCIFRVL